MLFKTKRVSSFDIFFDIGKNIPIYKTRLHMIYQAHHISNTRAYKSQNYLHISKKYCTFVQFFGKK